MMWCVGHWRWRDDKSTSIQSLRHWWSKAISLCAGPLQNRWSYSWLPLLPNYNLLPKAYCAPPEFQNEKVQYCTNSGRLTDCTRGTMQAEGPHLLITDGGEMMGSKGTICPPCRKWVLERVLCLMFPITLIWGQSGTGRVPERCVFVCSSVSA